MDRTDTEGDCIAGLQVNIYGHGRPILLVHGFGANRFTWSKIVAPLSLYYKVVTLDLKGFGCSQKPEDGRYSLRNQAEVVLRVIDGLALEGITLIGHSMGGGVALLVAMALERGTLDRLHRLVLIDSISCPQPLPLFIKLLRLPLLGELIVRLVPPTWQVRAILGIAYYDAGKIDRAFVTAYAAPLRYHDGRAALVATARQMIPSDLDNVIAQYRTIHVPVLLLWGRQDRIVPFTFSACVRDAIPNASVVLLDQCGHIPQEEWPDRTISTLREFIG